MIIPLDVSNYFWLKLLKYIQKKNIFYLLSTIYYLHLLSTIYYLLSTIYYLLSSIYYLLSTIQAETLGMEKDTYPGEVWDADAQEK